MRSRSAARMGRARGGGRRRRGAVSAELPEDAWRAQARAAVAREEAEELSQQSLHGEIVGPARRPDLAPRALLRVLVVAEPHELRPMSKTVLLQLVEANFDDELLPHRRLLELAGAPSVRLGEALLALLVQQRKHASGDLRLRLRSARARADVVDAAIVTVQTEQKRRDRRAAALLPTDPDDDAVCRLVRLHLHDAVTRPRQIRQTELLRDPPVEPRALQRLQPVPALRHVAGNRRQRHTG